MRWPQPFHLPPAARWHEWRSLGATTLRVPALPPETIPALWLDLEVAAGVWRRNSLAARAETLARILQDWRRSGAGAWREVLARSTGLSLPGLDAAWEVTFAPHTRESLDAALQAEHLDAPAVAALDAAQRLPRRLAHVISGNVLAPTVSVLLRGWILGAAQWLRPASREPLLASCLLEDLRERAPELADCTAVLWWPHAAEDLEAQVLGGADAVTMQGSDTSLAALEAKRRHWPARPTWVPYGSRWSAACISAASQTPGTAAAVARDVALFDQQGCLSPTRIFAERHPGLQDWCETLAAALQAAEESMPRGNRPQPMRAALRHWHESARLGVALGELSGFWEAGTLWGVALRAACVLDASPLDRHVHVVPFGTWQEIADAASESLRTLQGLALALDGWDETERQAMLRRLRPSRVASVGQLQEAPLGWCQDHREPFGSLLRAV